MAPGWMLMPTPPISRDPLPAQGLVRALYEFQGRNPQELSVRMGDTLQVETRGSPPWVLRGRREQGPPPCLLGVLEGGDSRVLPLPRLVTTHLRSWTSRRSGGWCRTAGGRRATSPATSWSPWSTGTVGGTVPARWVSRLPSPPCTPPPGGGGRGPPRCPLPLSPAPGQPPQPAPQLLAGGGDSLAEGQGLLTDVGGPLSPPTPTAPLGGAKPRSPLTVCPSAARCGAWGC